MAFVSPDQSAEIVLNITTLPTKIRAGRPVDGAQIAKLPSAARSSLITVTLVNGQFMWRSTDLITGRIQLFRSTPGVGTPVLGCYTDSALVPASVIAKGTVKTLRLFAQGGDTVLKLPKGSILARCSGAVKGYSTVFSLVSRGAKKGSLIIATNNGKFVMASPRIDPKMLRIKIGVVPRVAGQQPTVALLGVRSRAPVLQLLDGNKKWRDMTLPRIGAGSTFGGLVAVRIAGRTYLVLQVVAKDRSTTYRSVLVPEEMLRQAKSN